MARQNLMLSPNTPSSNLESATMETLGNPKINPYHPLFSPDCFPDDWRLEEAFFNKQELLSSLKNIKSNELTIRRLKRQLFVDNVTRNMKIDMERRKTSHHDYEVFGQFLNYFNCQNDDDKYNFIVNFYTEFPDLWDEDEETLLNRAAHCRDKFTEHYRPEFVRGVNAGQLCAYPRLNDIPYFQKGVKPITGSKYIITLEERHKQLDAQGFPDPNTGQPFVFKTKTNPSKMKALPRIAKLQKANKLLEEIGYSPVQPTEQDQLEPTE